MNCLFEFDSEFSATVIGTDEAGRGPGAGDVFGAAVCFKKNFKTTLNAEQLAILSCLNDSKKINPKLRAELSLIIKACSYYSIKQISIEEIEKNNILNAALLTMKLSCEDVLKQMDNAALTLVDGNRKIKNFTYPQTTVTKGDSKSASIAAASILAKVARDDYMQKLHKKYPQYGWAQNKGYLTRAHIDAIKTHGINEFHRKSFLKNLFSD